jgi:hypothetical protein
LVSILRVGTSPPASPATTSPSRDIPPAVRRTTPLIPTDKTPFDFGGGFDQANGLAFQADGKIIVAGVASQGSSGDFGVARLTTTGALDTSFGVGTGLVRYRHCRQFRLRRRRRHPPTTGKSSSPAPATAAPARTTSPPFATRAFSTTRGSMTTGSSPLTSRPAG